MNALLLLACPLCAQRPSSPGSALLVLAFIAVPFAVVALIARVVHKVDS